MANEREFHCVDCGHPETTKTQNAKRCHVCRLFRNLAYVRGRKRKCYLCEAEYVPVARDDHLCANCAFARADAQEVECRYCGRTRTSIAKTMRVCLWCARDPQHRREFERDVAKTARWRKEHAPGSEAVA